MLRKVAEKLGFYSFICINTIWNLQYDLSLSLSLSLIVGLYNQTAWNNWKFSILPRGHSTWTLFYFVTNQIPQFSPIEVYYYFVIYKLGYIFLGIKYIWNFHTCKIFYGTKCFALDRSILFLRRIYLIFIRIFYYWEKYNLFHLNKKIISPQITKTFLLFSTNKIWKSFDIESFDTLGLRTFSFLSLIFWFQSWVNIPSERKEQVLKNQWN